VEQENDFERDRWWM